ncbi:hypothetical protein BGP_5428 [Beggiatoa sp. PS]|nr:hypothetical protein BGP_5428 [Beggiatoa sp. PS]
MTHFMKSIVLLVVSLVLFGCVRIETEPTPTPLVSLKEVLTFSQFDQGDFQDLRFASQPNHLLDMDQMVETDAKTIKKLSFKNLSVGDETQIILMPNTRVKITAFGLELPSNQQQQSHLFVDHNSLHSKSAFRVKTQYITVTPLGTKYSVKAHQQNFSIDVFEGSTQLTSNTQSWQPQLVKKHENGVARGQNRPETQPIATTELAKLIHPITQLERVKLTQLPTPKPLYPCHRLHLW